MNKIKKNYILPLPLVLIALVISLPLFTIVGFLFAGVNENWQHLVDTVLPDYVINSLLLMLGVSVGTLSMGVITAWLTSMFDFYGRKFLSWGLLLPLALPAYIIAYTYTGMLDFAGPVQTLFREISGLEYGEYWFFDVRSLTGAIILLSLVLYPYVYMMARSAFIEQSICVLEVSRTLGSSISSSFIKIAIPLARPAIITGLSLALMETLADYGTVQYFGISTFTTGIFRTWYGLDDSVTAAQLSAFLLFFIFSLILLEKWSRKQAKFHHTSNKYSRIELIKLSGFKQLLAFIACFLPLALGFILPAVQLGFWSATMVSQVFNQEFMLLVWHTLTLAFFTSLVAIVLALIFAYSKRWWSSPIISYSVQVASLGYAIPGTIIAVGIILPLTWFDQTLNDFFLDNFNVELGLFLSGSIVALVFAYTVRFLSISIQAVESGLAKIKPSMDESAQILGTSGFKLLGKVHIPLMRGTVLTAILLVFVDVLKELPATLLLRPFNFNTLAVRTYEMASDERLADAAPSALAIVLVGIVPVILLSKSINKSRASGHS